MMEPTSAYTPSPTRYDTMTYNRCGSSGLKLPAISWAAGTTSATTRRSRPCAS